MSEADVDPDTTQSSNSDRASVASVHSRPRRATVHQMVDDLRPGADADTKRKLQQEMKELQHALAMEGLSQTSFFLGVCNIVITAIIFGKYPQNAWAWYGVLVFLLIPAWWYHVMKFRTGHLFILDLCWAMNICQGIYMVLTAFEVVPDNLSKWFFQAFFMNACSFLSWSVVVLGNAVIFHSIERMASLFIHITPMLVSLVMRWESYFGRTDTWRLRNNFPSELEMDQTATSDLLLTAFVVYGTWWAFYTLWLLTVGVGMPEKGWPTVFGNMYERSHLDQQFARCGLESLRSHAFAYMLAHLLLCSISFGWAVACWWSPYLHLTWVLLTMAFAVWSGAGYYLHVVIKKLGPALNAPLTEIEMPVVEPVEPCKLHMAV